MNEMNHAGTVPRLRIAAGVAALAFATTACIAHGLAFVKSNQLQIISPKSHTLVKTPVTVRWEVHDFRITGHDGRSNPNAGYFGVFVDRAPVPPGKPLSYVSHGDRQCEHTRGCPDRTYLADHDTYATTNTSFTLHALPDQSAYHGHELHEVTIVILDGRGDRIGENAWYVDFRYDRTGL
jgi:hypothetical protein